MTDARADGWTDGRISFFFSPRRTLLSFLCLAPPHALQFHPLLLVIMTLNYQTIYPTKYSVFLVLVCMLTQFFFLSFFFFC